MILAENTIVPFIKKNIPWFVNQSYPEFVQFLSFYYEWLERLDPENSYGVLALLDNYKRFHDIDTTLKELVPRFKSVYYRLLPNQTTAETRIFVKHIGELYRAKGSEDSFRLLIYILTGKESYLFYPRTLLARSSHVQYGTDTFVQCEMNIPSEEVFLMENKRIRIDDVLLVVDKVVKIYNTFRLFIQFPDTFTKIENPIIVYNENEVGICIPILAKVSIVSATPLNSLKEEVFKIKSSVSDSVSATIKVSALKKDKIDSFVINNKGYRYNEDDSVYSSDNGAEVLATVTKVDQDGGILDCKISHSDFFNTLPEVFINSNGLGASIKWVSKEIRKPLALTILDHGIRFPEDSFVETKENITISCIPNFIGKITKFHSEKNLLGQFNILPDNFYFQRFSYVINAEHSSLLDKQSIIDLLHPTGFKCFFNMMIIGNESAITTSLSEHSCIQEPNNLSYVFNSEEGDTKPYMFEMTKYGSSILISSLYDVPFKSDFYFLDLLTTDVEIIIT